MTLPFMEPIHILGSGSIGCFWASSIRTAFPSYPLAVLLRSQHKPKFLKNDHMASRHRRPEVMVCTMQNGRRPRMASVPIEFIGGDENENKAPIRNVILATKAYQAPQALKGILPRLAPSARIFILSNGALDIRENLDNLFWHHEKLSKQAEGASFRKDKSYIMCTTTHGVIREEENESAADDDSDDHMILLDHVGKGRSFLGGIPAMAQLWDQSGLNATSIGNEDTAESVNPMEVYLWKKLVGNCFCNPLTALWGVTNGEIMRHNEEQSLRIRSAVVKEVSAVAQAINPTWPAEAISPMALDAFVEQLIQENRENRSSMYYDLLRRRRTEVESLNGYVVRKGREAGIETPANEDLLQQIESLQCYGMQDP